MNRLIAAALAALIVAPAAQAQDWAYPNKGTKGDCFALTMRGDRGFAIQAPGRDAGDQGAILFIGPLGALHDGAGDILFAFDAPGKWSRPAIAHGIDDEDLTSAVLTLDRFDDVDTLPDRFRVRVSRGKEVALDTEVTGFKAALAEVRTCVAER